MKLYVIEAPYPLNIATDTNEFIESNYIREALPSEIREAARPLADSIWWCKEHKSQAIYADSCLRSYPQDRCSIVEGAILGADE